MMTAGNSQPMEYIYFFAFKTSSGITHSRIEAWKYNKHFPKEPEAFSRDYAEMLFSRYAGVMEVYVVVLHIAVTVTRAWIKRVANTDLHNGLKALGKHIFARYTFARPSGEIRGNS